ncbi:MAG: PEP-CTERM sorting domain-containing protein, partial [Candidatus Hydrogenedentes bacterium]|nr:PEP-CTERM sorting domain-containing protein [Candidatus Hydrogenedentota bacterium]
MRVPLISGYRELEQPQRRFLMYVAINVISWQNIVGPATILFARKIEMPESLVGVMLSFMPFSTLLLLFTVPMIMRLGPKRVMMNAWLGRNIIACIIFLMPLALATGERWLSWSVLLLTVLGFCILRAVGAGGWLPWLHEIVPVKKRSVYFSTEAAITQLINVAVLFTQARLLAVPEPGTNRFLLIFGLGITMGLLSLLWMRRIPGGEGMPEVEVSSGMAALRRAAADRTFTS